MENKAKELFQEFQKEQELKKDKKDHDSNDNRIWTIIGVILVIVSVYKFSQQWHLSTWIVLGGVIGVIMIKIGKE